MPRTYKRKRAPVDEESMKKAVLAVEKDNMPIKTAAKKFKVSRATLQRWCKATSQEQITNNIVATQKVGRNSVCMRSVTSSQPESELNSLTSSRSNAALSVTLQSVRSYPKAAPRKQTRKGRQKRKTAILTDSPERQKIAEEQAKRDRKKTSAAEPKKRGRKKKTVPECAAEPQPSTSTGITRKHAPKKRTQTKAAVPSSDSDIDEICSVCLDDVISKLAAIKCSRCKRWSHDNCVRSATPIYICLNCLSDVDDEDTD